MDKVIVIATYGWVFVGDIDYQPRDSDNINLTNAKNVRVWGTAKGLGQIALHGPTKETVLDPVGVVRLPVSSVVATIECAADKWAKV